MIVGLSGWAGSGKDTAAAGLVEVGWTPVGFADPLKDLAFCIGWDGRKDEVGRKLLQELGVGARTILGRDVWVDALMRRLPELAVITDVRFPNELDAIERRGGLVVRIVRPGVIPARQHVSETALDGHDFVHTLVNDSTPDALAEALVELVARRWNGCQVA